MASLSLSAKLLYQKIAEYSENLIFLNACDIKLALYLFFRLLKRLQITTVTNKFKDSKWYKFQETSFLFDTASVFGKIFDANIYKLCIILC